MIGVGLSLLLDQWLEAIKYAMAGALIGGVSWEIITHYATLRKMIKDGLAHS